AKPVLVLIVRVHSLQQLLTDIWWCRSWYQSHLKEQDNNPSALGMPFPLCRLTSVC
ncbi:hypothetical protein BaRGS_00013096, partial [Batillaria attramentaria]